MVEKIKSKFNKKSIYVSLVGFFFLMLAIVLVITVNKVDWEDEGFNVENVTNDSWYSKNGNMEIFRNDADIYTFDGDTISKDPLIDADAFYLNITEEGIFYENRSDESYIYKSSLDGKNSVALVNDDATNVLVKGDWVYYTNYDDDGKIYRIKTDGSNREKITDKGSLGFTIIGDKLLYPDWSEGGSLYEADLEGKNKKKLTDVPSWRLTNTEDHIYFIKELGFEGNLYRYVKKTGEIEKVIDDLVTHYFLHDNVIYYNVLHMSKNEGFHKYDLTTKKSSLLDKGSYFGMFLKDGYILMRSDFNSNLYSLNPSNDLIDTLE